MKKITANLVLGTSLLLAVFICCSAYNIWTYGSQTELIHADAAIVLGTAVLDDEPSPVLRERINHSIWLYENGYVDKIIFTGGKTNGAIYAESEVSKNYAMKHDIPAEDIYIETRSMITEENFLYASEIAAEHDLEDFLVVSDPLHMKRALSMAEDAGIDGYSSPTTSSEYKTLSSKIPFFLREVVCYVGYVLLSFN